MKDLADRRRGYNDSSSQSDRWDLATVDEFVREASRNPEKLAGSLYGDRQRLRVLLGIHDR
jgi:hypothetical protein